MFPHQLLRDPCGDRHEWLSEKNGAGPPVTSHITEDRPQTDKNPMQDRKCIPTALNIVAILFLIGGISSALGMLIRLRDGQLHLDLGILGIPTYFGLRRFSKGWRIYALVCVWFVLVVSPICFVLGFAISQPAHFSLLGLNTGKVSPLWLSIVSVLFFAISLWQLRILTRREIRAKFHEGFPG